MNHHNHDMNMPVDSKQIVQNSLSSLVNNVLSTKATDSGEHSHHNNNIEDSHGMSMSFHAGYKELILFDFWHTKTIPMFLLSCLIVLVFSALYEAIKFWREILFQSEIIRQKNSKKKNLMNEPSDDVNSTEKLENGVENTIENPAAAIKGGKSSIKMYLKKSLRHSLHSVLYVLQLFISFLLMLVFMTYNVWLCLSIILGAGIGHFFFSFKRAQGIDTSTMCH